MKLYSKSTFFRQFGRIIVCSYLNVSSVAQSTKFHRVVIVGAGTGGCAVTNRLCRKLEQGQVAVIEPSSIHYYQPLWTLVGAGIRNFNQSFRLTSEILTPLAHWYKANMTRLDPDNSIVQLSTGEKISYEYLVLAMGIKLRFDKINGADDALKNDPRVCSNYSPNYVEKTFIAYQNFIKGQAIFTLPAGPIKCAGAPQKVMYLFDDYLRKQGKRDQAEFHYFTGTPKIFTVDKYAHNLSEICKHRKINCNLQHHLIEVNWRESEVVFENLTNKNLRKIKYDFLHITPPMSTDDLLKSVPKLTDPNQFDYVDVNKGSLKHNYYKNIMAIGDCAALPTSKTGAAISAQSKVLVENLLDSLKGGNGQVHKYDGYTACPLLTGYNRGIVAEFDYTYQPLETLPIDQGKENYINYWMKVFFFPTLYWNWLLKGLWSGPAKIRKILHLGRSR